MIKITDTKKEFPEGEESVFPRFEEYKDFTGKTINFKIDCHEVGLGFTVIAIEDKEEASYRFESYSPNNPFEALGNVRDKIRAGLSTRYLDDDVYPTHGKLKGYITCDSNRDGHGIVIDGTFLDINKIERILSAYEGFEILIEIKDSKD